MFEGFRFDRVDMPAGEAELRQSVRGFLRDIQSEIPFEPNSDFNVGYDADFSAALARQGWIGMTWPSEYGGGERSFLERYIITEELLAAGAPVEAHWIADRQTGPVLLKFGTEAQRAELMPAIARGEVFCSIGMSEPDSGSDLASIRTRATRTDGGWLVNGTKIWTSAAHRNHYMIALVRTDAPSENRHAGMSQVLIDLRGEGVNIRPIRNMAGEAEFNEVQFDDAFVADDRVVGEVGNGWNQVMSELAYERSGPERFLSSFRVFIELVRAAGSDPTPEAARAIGDLAAQLMTLRQMSISIAGMLEQGESPVIEPALVKELGNTFERELPELARLIQPFHADSRFRRAMVTTLLRSPSFTLRGGTREILRGMIARGLGLR